MVSELHWTDCFRQNGEVGVLLIGSLVCLLSSRSKKKSPMEQKGTKGVTGEWGNKYNQNLTFSNPKWTRNEA